MSERCASIVKLTKISLHLLNAFSALGVHTISCLSFLHEYIREDICVKVSGSQLYREEVYNKSLRDRENDAVL